MNQALGLSRPQPMAGTPNAQETAAGLGAQTDLTHTKPAHPPDTKGERKAGITISKHTWEAPDSTAMEQIGKK